MSDEPQERKRPKRSTGSNKKMTKIAIYDPEDEVGEHCNKPSDEDEEAHDDDELRQDSYFEEDSGDGMESFIDRSAEEDDESTCGKEDAGEDVEDVFSQVHFVT
ncbi:hypothetical protein diail_12279 [Diaporthe ilicicola]|nr:hypothetical protein diail_12279 [Diaporthe ilicicola]